MANKRVSLIQDPNNGNSNKVRFIVDFFSGEFFGEYTKINVYHVRNIFCFRLSDHSAHVLYIIYVLCRVKWCICYSYSINVPFDNALYARSRSIVEKENVVTDNDWVNKISYYYSFIA